MYIYIKYLSNNVMLVILWKRSSLHASVRVDKATRVFAVGGESSVLLTRNLTGMKNRMVAFEKAI